MTSEKDILSIRDNFVPVRKPVRTRKVFTARKSKKHESILSVLCAFIVEHQIGIAVNLLSLLSLVHLLFPRSRRVTRKFFELSYHDAASRQYGRGWDDLYFVFFCIVVLTGARAATMDYILRPFARMGGIQSKKISTRFAEQAWIVIYDTTSWSVGMYIYYNSPYWLNMKELWTHFPTLHTSLLMKGYYLVQFSFWLQQIFVINIEERRKDHWQMFTHHIFTCALLLTSYGFYQTSVGNVFLCLMDIGDILLAFAKLLNYLRFRTICDIMFGLFLVSWVIARHACYLMVCWSLIRDVGVEMPYGCYDSSTGALVSSDPGTAIFANVLQPFNDPNGLVCFNPQIRWSFLGLLSALQVITIIWFGMICGVAYRVLTGKGGEDPRSDDEDDVEEEEIELDWDEKAALNREAGVDAPVELPIEMEVDGSEVTGAFKSVRAGSPATRTRSQKRSAARASAISIPGHGDHKELLGRIGCDKPT